MVNNPMDNWRLVATCRSNDDVTGIAKYIVWSRISKATRCLEYLVTEQGRKTSFKFSTGTAYDELLEFLMDDLKCQVKWVN